MHCRPVFICLYVKRINVVCYFSRKVEGTRLVSSVLLLLPMEPEYFHSQFLKITLVTHLLFYFIFDPPKLLPIYRRNILSFCSFIIDRSYRSKVKMRLECILGHRNEHHLLHSWDFQGFLEFTTLVYSLQGQMDLRNHKNELCSIENQGGEKPWIEVIGCNNWKRINLHTGI